MEPNRKVRKQGLEHFIKFVRELPSPSPQAMFQALQEHGYRGQDSARRALCLMAYRHVKRIKRIYIDGVGERIAEDTGGGVKGNHIDVYLPSVPAATRRSPATGPTSTRSPRRRRGPR